MLTQTLILLLSSLNTGILAFATKACINYKKSTDNLEDSATDLNEERTHIS